MKKNKISLIGAGNIGGALAQLIILENLGDIVLFDVNESLAKGKALDLSQSTHLHSSNPSIIGSSDYENIKDSDVIIITAGLARKPGMSRDDLVESNTKIINKVGKNIAEYSPNAFVICITNPLDAMVWVLQKACGLPHNKVVGMAGVLDSARFAFFIAEELQVSVNDVQAFVLGGHGDSMVPLTNYVTVSGIGLHELIKLGKISQETVDSIIQRTKDGGAEIVKLLGNGSAFYAPAASAIKMAKSYLLNQKKLLPAAVYVNGEYGIKDIYLGLLSIIDGSGVSEVVEVPLSPKDIERLNKSVAGVKDLIKLSKSYIN